MNAESLKKYGQLVTPFAPRRPIMQHPWLIPIAGQTWCVATDGRGILGYKMEGPYPPISECPDSTMYVETIVKYLSAEMKGISMGLAELRKWLGTPLWLEEYPCSDCKGRGTFTCNAFCKEGHHCERCCEYANCSGGEQKCPDCSGGKKTRHPRIFGTIKGTLYDTNLIACALEAVDDGLVDIAFGQHIPVGPASLVSSTAAVLYLTGENWRFVVMPCAPMSSIQEQHLKIERGELVLV